MNIVNSKLSICIPTFNRANELEKNIINLIPLCKSLNVEIIISDNNSSDNTYEIVSKYINIYDKIKYVKLNSNYGIDFNINSAIINASSEYCWLLGDDDFIFESAISEILNYLSEFKPDFLLLNCEERNIFSNEILKSSFFNLKKEFEVIAPNVLMSEYSGIMTLLSACVVNRKIWEKVKLNEYKFKYYFHMFNIFTSLSFDSTVLVINKPLFVRYAGNLWKFEKEDFDDILHYYYPMTIESSNGKYSYSDQLKGIRMKIKKVNIGTFLRLRGKNLCSIRLFPTSYFILMRYNLVLAFFVLLLPASLSVYIYKIGLKIFRRNERL